MLLPFLNDLHVMLPLLAVPLLVATIAWVRQLRRQAQKRASRP
jgi:hypothetical protein